MTEPIIHKAKIAKSSKDDLLNEREMERTIEILLEGFFTKFKDTVLVQLRDINIQNKEYFTELNLSNQNKVSLIEGNLSMTTRVLDGAVTKLEHLHSRIFTGNGSTPLNTQAQLTTQSMEEVKRRLDDLDKFKWWIISGLIGTFATSLISVLLWIIQRSISK